MTKTTLKNTAARIGKFRASQDGAVATWFAILLVPMLGFTYGAIKFANLTEQRSSMTDAMDASALAIARQYEVLDVDPCNVATAGPGRVAGKDDEGREQVMRFGREFFAENYAEYGQLYRDRDLKNPLDLEQDLTFDLSCDTITMGVVAYTDMGGVLASHFGLKSVMLNLESNVTLFQQSKMEVALVLDVTGSMGWYSTPGNTTQAPVGERRIDKMREAVQGMLDHEKVFGEEEESDRVKFSVVPFTTFVNVGATYSNTVDERSDSVANWMDGWSGTPQAHYHGANFLHAYEENYEFHAHPAGGSDTKKTPRVRVSSQKVNHFDLFRSVGDGDDADATWKGCVEARPFPLDEIAHPPGQRLPDLELTRAFTRPSSATSTDPLTNAAINAAWESLGARPTEDDPDPQTIANSRFVPSFWGDDPYCRALYPWHDCGFVPDEDEDYADRTPHDLAGRRWGDDWRVIYTKERGWHWSFTDGPIPRQLFSDGRPSARNANFIQDYTFLSLNHADAKQEDKDRYRNLIYTVFQHGLNRTDPYLRWPDADTAPGGPASNYDKCRKPQAPYSYDPNVLAAMDRFGVRHCEDEVKLRRAYVGIYKPNQRRYFGKYENLEGSNWSGPINPSSYSAANNGPNQGCPGPVLPLTNQKSEIEDVLAALQPKGGTNSAIGMTWGWRTLTHEAPYIEAVDPETHEGKQWYKIAILLSDGDNNGNEPDHSYYDAWGYGVENRVRGDGTYGGHRQAIDDKTIRMCHRMRSRGIKVYTIGFAITAGSSADRMLKACAVDTDSYFLASNASDLNKAFDEIADQITELHVSG